MRRPRRQDQPQLALEPVLNRGLFADHFLRNRLGDLEAWQSPDGIEEAFRAIKVLYDEKATRFTDQTNEPQTERSFIRPVLSRLWREEAAGDCYEVQVSIPNVDAQRQPDYAFFRCAADREAADPKKGTIEYWESVPCLGDAKRWSASLDKERGAGENPSAQIANYLYRSRVRWGILTNGRIWRLYEREKSSAGGVFYEVDLEGILRSGGLQDFKYFYLFFRRAAFLPDESGQTFLDKVFQGSVDHATDVGDRLKDAVYDALRLLMNGFFEHEGNGLDPGDTETVKQVHEDSLIVLYRLLFLLYAEDRELLPRRQEPYATYGLYRIQREINDHLRAGGTYPPVGRRFWSELCNLFALIDRGYAEARIPAYNGGLFSRERHPHIAHTPVPDVPRWEIGDHRLAEAIDMLAYRRERWNEPGSQDIDYKSLDAQHLGSVYEGLLELKPQIAEEPLVETLDGGKPVFKPASEVSGPRPVRGQPAHTINANEVYLVTDRGERKATGSYYTPKFIVDHIVQHAVGPLADQAARQVAELRPEVDREIRRLERKRTEWEAEAEKKRTAAVKRQIAGLHSQIEEQRRRLLEPYLSLKILDPAMGSGHFLVGASDFLSLAMATDPNLLPLDEIGDEDPQAHYKRLLVERCLYGVDLNPLAVELAKLSLWLHTVSRDKALSFLDHHLRCGNSLIGARIEEDLGREPPRFSERGRQVNAQDQQQVLGFYDSLTGTHLQYLLDTFREIMEKRAADAEAQREKDGLYRTMDAVRDHFRQVANCWLAPYFGAPVAAERYQQAVQALRGTPAFAAFEQEHWFKDAQDIARDNRFFHWELEFPELFFDADGFKARDRRGFDAVIGNPPYLFGEQIPTDIRAVCRRYGLAKGQYDVYWLFYELALKLLLRRGGNHGYIVPDPVLARDETGSLRRILTDSCRLYSIAHVGAVFEDPNVSAAIVVWGNEDPDDASVTTGVRAANEVKRTAFRRQSSFRRFPGYRWLVRLDEATANMVARVFDGSVALGELVEVSRGEELGRRHLTETCTADTEPILLGEDIATLGHPVPSKYMNSSSVRKPRRIYASPKLVFVKTGGRVLATVDRSDLVTLQSVYNLHATSEEVGLAYLAALMKSRLLNLVACATFTDYKEIFPQFNQSTVEQLPIRSIEFSTPADERTRLVEDGKRLCEEVVLEDSPDSALAFVQEQLAATPERADVVHDLLAYLAQQMIDMNKQKQGEAEGFLAWLERYISANVEHLTNKTKVKEYHEYDLDTLLDILRANRRRLGIDPTARDSQEAIGREFTKSVGKLEPLKRRIAATDRLIDLIVYRLYGLTEEEIAIVESAHDATGSD